MVVLIVLVLVGIIVGVSWRDNSDKDMADRENKEQDIIVYETDENTIEEKVENGLQASDSEDGPILDENSMIDFNGSNYDATDNDKNNTGKSDDKDHVGDNIDEPNNESQINDKETDSKDTGTWGGFY